RRRFPAWRRGEARVPSRRRAWSFSARRNRASPCRDRRASAGKLPRGWRPGGRAQAMKLALSPIDTWFFRDGTPFDMGASPQAGVLGVCPPYPPTVAGAVRAALALQNGWDGRSRWSQDIEAVLGDGPETLGALRTTGPFVLHQGAPV